MSVSDGDRWLKRIWLVNGVALLLLLLGGLVVAGVSLLGDWRGEKAVAVAAPSEEPVEGGDRARAVRFDVPEDIRGTTTRIVLVRNGADYLPAGSYDLARKVSDGGPGEGPLVNVAFLPANGAAGHLLFGQPAFLTEVAYPGVEYGRADSLQTWITYEAVLTDSNGDGKLNGDDNHELMVTDLDGNNLRRILPARLQLKSYRTLKDHRTILVTALERPASPDGKFDEHRAPERAFVYDVAAGQLQSIAPLDSLMAQAGRVMVARAPGSGRK